MDGHDADNTKQSTADMTVFLRLFTRAMLCMTSQINTSRLLANFSYFVSALAGTESASTNGESISLHQLDDMGNRIDELEQSINDLRIEMGQEGSSSPSATVKSKDDTKSADDSA
ncbi:hypothetical protein R3W88_001486 [Solanum pinnatisectum]|uniref:Heat shock factor binding protein n=1 Tax=Solanum pinnatisectum TaxID=50273 RepID=A0AAV9ML32_9SOLN|nr:hypothetical protein R3W88_001486 [Solanum pinnatisectum]